MEAIAARLLSQFAPRAGIDRQRVERAEEVYDVVYAAAQMTFSSNRPIAVLLGQRLIGFKDWSK